MLAWPSINPLLVNWSKSVLGINFCSLLYNTKTKFRQTKIIIKIIMIIKEWKIMKNKVKLTKLNYKFKTTLA